jgi:hypothetical protein
MNYEMPNSNRRLYKSFPLDATPTTTGGRMSENKLTPEQVENWRKVLFGIVGTYALIMSVEEIQLFRDKMQQKIDDNPPEDE